MKHLLLKAILKWYFFFDASQDTFLELILVKSFYFGKNVIKFFMRSL